MHCQLRLVLATLASVTGAAHAQLNYAEVSTGLNTLAWDGGRTALRLADLDQDGHIDLVTVGDHARLELAAREGEHVSPAFTA